jgi:hypothetical protein
VRRSEEEWGGVGGEGSRGSTESWHSLEVGKGSKRLRDYTAVAEVCVATNRE